MDQAYFSAFAALAGSVIGGVTSLATSWLTQRAQFRAQRVSHDLGRREDLYWDFIEEASRLYADAFEHDEADIAKLVKLYALIGRMCVLSSPTIIDSADRVARVIVETYLGPNKSFRDLPALLEGEAIDPLREFSNLCREDCAGRKCHSRGAYVKVRVLESIGAFFPTRTTVEQERYFVDALLRARGPAELDVSAALGAREARHGGLLSREDGVPRWQIFVPRPRLSVQAIRTRSDGPSAVAAS